MQLNMNPLTNLPATKHPNITTITTETQSIADHNRTVISHDITRNFHKQLLGANSDPETKHSALCDWTLRRVRPKTPKTNEV